MVTENSKDPATNAMGIPIVVISLPVLVFCIGILISCSGSSSAGRQGRIRQGHLVDAKAGETFISASSTNDLVLADMGLN